MMDRRSWIGSISLSLLFVLFGCTIQQQSSITRQEKSALLHLRSTLGLRAKEWPRRSNPCTSWVGIQCTHGRVTGMNISGFRRTRQGRKNPKFSVDSLPELTLLSSFNASYFPLPGPIPDWFGLQLPALQVLDLRSCSINGTIPFTLGNLSSLVQLYLSNNNLTGTIPSSLFQLPGLSVLHLSTNSLTGLIPDAFNAPGNLTILDLSANSLCGEIPPRIGSLLELQLLNISRNALSSSIPAQLGNLSKLLVVDLGSNSLSGPVLVNFTGMTNLQRIILRNNNFTSELPGNLWSLPSLQFLDVSGNNFTGILPNNASATNTTTAANISQNSFYGNITPIISRFSFTDLSGNYLQGPVPTHANGTTHLSRNCLRNTENQRSATECASFYAARKLEFDFFGDLPATNISGESDNEGRRRRKKRVGILLIVIVAVGLLVLFHVAAAGLWGRAAVADLYRICFGFVGARLGRLCRLRNF